MERKINHPLCPKCQKPMRVIVPINMAVCDECGEKYYIERVSDTDFTVVGKYYEVKAQKLNEQKEDEVDWINKDIAEEKEPEEKLDLPPVVGKPEIKEEQVEQEEQEPKEEQEEPITEEESEKNEKEEKNEDVLSQVLPPMISDTRYLEYKKYVDKYVNRRYWVQVAKEELKNLVAELYDAGALGSSFNPGRVAKILMNMSENMVLPFYGVEWLDKAVTKELLTRIWLKLQGYREIIKLEKLKYYIAVFHKEDLQAFLDGTLPEIKVKKYIQEMEALEE